MQNMDESYTHFGRPFHLHHMRHRLHEPRKMRTKSGASDGGSVMGTQNVNYLSSWSSLQQTVSTQEDVKSKASIMTHFLYPSLLSCTTRRKELSSLKSNDSLTTLLQKGENKIASTQKGEKKKLIATIFRHSMLHLKCLPPLVMQIGSAKST